MTLTNERKAAITIRKCHFVEYNALSSTGSICPRKSLQTSSSDRSLSGVTCWITYSLYKTGKRAKVNLVIEGASHCRSAPQHHSMDRLVLPVASALENL